jgi:hypothetical protein
VQIREHGRGVLCGDRLRHGCLLRWTVSAVRLAGWGDVGAMVPGRCCGAATRRVTGLRPRLGGRDWVAQPHLGPPPGAVQPLGDLGGGAALSRQQHDLDPHSLAMWTRGLRRARGATLRTPRRHRRRRPSGRSRLAPGAASRGETQQGAPPARWRAMAGAEFVPRARARSRSPAFPSWPSRPPPRVPRRGAPRPGKSDGGWVLSPSHRRRPRSRSPAGSPRTPSLATPVPRPRATGG